MRPEYLKINVGPTEKFTIAKCLVDTVYHDKKIIIVETGEKTYRIRFEDKYAAKKTMKAINKQLGKK